MKYKCNECKNEFDGTPYAWITNLPTCENCYIDNDLVRDLGLVDISTQPIQPIRKGPKQDTRMRIYIFIIAFTGGWLIRALLCEYVMRINSCF